MPITQEEIQAALSKLQAADKAYYDAAQIKGVDQTGAGDTLMSDDEYDALRDWVTNEIEKLSPTDPLRKEVEIYLGNVGAAPTTGTWQKRKHEIPMGSLHKVQGVGALKDWFAKTENLCK